MKPKYRKTVALLTVALLLPATGSLAEETATGRKLPERIGGYDFRYETDLTRRIGAVHEPSRDTWINTAWTVMAIQQGMIPKEHVHPLSGAILKYWEKPEKRYSYFHGLETYVAEKHGQQVAGSITMARTIPPARQMLLVRPKLMIEIAMIHDLQEVLLDLADKHKTAVMPGYTHIRHAQPMTFGHYMLSVHDAIERSMESVEHAYHLMSLNELGCGALAGTSWPIDRNLLSEYLGLDGLIENANDAVGYTDGYLTLVAGLTNVVNVASRVGLELNFWSGLEYDFLDFDMGFGSHMMPNKRSNQPLLERTRVASAKMAGHLSEVAAMGARCPHGDMHEMLHMADGTVAALETTHTYLHVLIYFLPGIQLHEDKMLATARRGYSCSTELANQIVRDHKLDYRTAHEVVAQFVKASAAEGIAASESRIEMLEAAAEEVTGKKLGMKQEALRQALDPVHFVEVTNSQGGVAPKEVARMIADRRGKLAKARARHLQRVEKLEKAKARMLADLQAIHEASGKP